MATDYLQQEGGLPGKITLEDGSGALILESSTVGAADDIGAQYQRIGMQGKMIYGIGPVRSR